MAERSSRGVRGSISAQANDDSNTWDITTKRAWLTGFTLTTSANGAGLTIYDGTTSSAEVDALVVARVVVPGSSLYGGRDYHIPRYCANGIRAKVDVAPGDSANAIIEYIESEV